MDQLDQRAVFPSHFDSVSLCPFCTFERETERERDGEDGENGGGMVRILSHGLRE